MPSTMNMPSARAMREAASRMARALEMFIIEGIHTSIPLQRKIVADPDFLEGNVDTKFMERYVK